MKGEIVNLSEAYEAVSNGVESKSKSAKGKKESDNELEKDSEDEVQNENQENSQLLSEHVGVRSGLPPLLVRVAERPAERLDYIGVSYGLTDELYRFWHR